jgi:murein L,D-transpeptidase YcbB/YkuD
MIPKGANRGRAFERLPVSRSPRVRSAMMAARMHSDRTMLRRARNSAPAWLAALAIAASVALVGPARAQEVDEILRVRVEQLRESGMLDIEGAAIAARRLIPEIYEARAFAPAWRRPAQVDALLEVIEQSRSEGLDPRDYHLEQVQSARLAFEDVDAIGAVERAGMDILLTDAVIRLGYHLRFGKVDPVALDSDWNFSRELTDRDPAEVIQAAIDAQSMREFAAEVIPRNFFYERLRGALAEYREIEMRGGWPTVPSGPVLKAGMRDGRVPALAERLAITGDYEPPSADDRTDRGAVATNGRSMPVTRSAPPGRSVSSLASTPDVVSSAESDAVDPLLYDGPLIAAVRRFQERHGLSVDGVVGAATLSALNVPVAARIDQIRANLERGRWVLGDLDDDFVIVNVAGFKLYVVRDGEVERSMRVQVGRPYRKTPVFKSRITYLVFNPTWTVPPTIFTEDILPELRRDAAYLATRDIELFDSSGNLLDPQSVDWRARTSLPYRLVQRPGPNNALGRVKFMFPNDHSVYLHDTPSRDLFERDSRAFSSGCIRLEEPLELALDLLGPAWNAQRVATLLASGSTETVFLDAPLTVMLLYWTTEVDAEGRVYFLPDVYARDAAVIAELSAPFRAASTL